VLCLARLLPGELLVVLVDLHQVALSVGGEAGFEAARARTAAPWQAPPPAGRRVGGLASTRAYREGS
jgi:hypothetical protein